jgi:hypothetical protein
METRLNDVHRAAFEEGQHSRITSTQIDRGSRLNGLRAQPVARRSQSQKGN